MTALRHALTRHWLAKIVSVLLALLLWLIVSSSQERIGTLPGGVQIQLENTPSGLVAELDEEVVEVKVIAERALWQGFDAHVVRATVDLTGATEGIVDRFVTVTSQVPGARIVQVVPDRVLVRVEPVAQRSVPVVTRTTGALDDEFTTSSITVEPQKVLVKGRKSDLDRIDEVVATVPLNGQRETFKQVVSVEVDSADELMKGVTTTPTTVLATTVVERAANVKTVGITVDTVGSPPAGYTISAVSVTPSVVTVAGSATALGSLTALSTEPVRLSELRETSQLTTTLRLPPGVKLVEPSPSLVSVTMQVQPTE